MSLLHMKHIRQALETRFVPHIDKSDIRNDDTYGRQQVISRALAAVALAHYSDISDDESARSVTDSYDDNGIDGIYYDKPSAILNLVQSKWSEKGEGSLALGDAEKMLSGIEKLLREDYASFNKKISDRRDEIGSALRNADINIRIIVVHTGSQKISPNVKSCIDSFLSTQNDTGEIMSFHYMSQAEIHAAISKSIDNNSISLEILLRDWGYVKEPYLAFYGRVSASDVAAWWSAYKNKIFAKNIRKFINDSAINAQIQETLVREPEHFWYYNNGITLLCQSVQKKLLGGSDRGTAIVQCEGATVVNGAQTVGTIGRALATGVDGAADAMVMVRVLSLEGCPEGFVTSVTKATNTQNRVQSRDFASLDPEQERIAREMLFEGRRYVYKTGDDEPLRSEGCSIEEATIALACAARDLKLTVMAKGQIGALWEDINRPPYKLIFNSSVTAETIWRRVRVLREVEEMLAIEAHKSSGVRMQVAIHGNRFVLRQVFRLIAEKLPQNLDEIVNNIIDEVVKVVNQILPDFYLAWTFKNLTKCQNIEDHLDRTSTFAEINTNLKKAFVMAEHGNERIFSFDEESIEGIVDPTWTIDKAVAAASSWYRPGSMTSGQARSAAIEAWAACTGRDNAVSELNRIIREQGSDTAAARFLGMSTVTLRRFKRSFPLMPTNPSVPRLPHSSSSAQLELLK